MKYLYIRLLTILTAFILFFGCLSTTVFADERKVIRVGYVENYGISIDEVTGELSGYMFEYLAKIAQYTHWDYEYIPVTWNEGLTMLSDGELDLFGPMQKTAEREWFFDYPDEEMGLEYGAIYVAEDEHRFFYNDFSALDEINLGIQEGSYYRIAMDEYCQKNGITVNYVITTAGESFYDLKSHRIDAFLCGSFLTGSNTSVIEKIAVEPFYYTTTKGNHEVLDGMNMALAQILRENAYFAADLNRKYYSDQSINLPAYTREEVQFIKDKPKLTVACDSSWAPMEYFDEKSNSYHGVNIDILVEIGRVSGLDFEIMHTKTYEGSKALAKTGNVDLLLGYTNPAATDLGVSYTESFIDIPVILVGRNSIDLSDKLNVAIRAKNSTLSADLKKQFPIFNYVEYPTSNDVIDALINNEVDGAFLSAYVFDEFARSQSLEKYVTVPTNVTFPQCIGVSDNLPPVAISVLNKAIHRISADQISTIVFSNTVGRAYTVPLFRVIKENAYIIFLFLTLFFLAILYISFVGRKKLAKLAYVDTLTGVSTLTRFRMDVEAAMKNARPEEFMLMSLDIDDFKYVNDSFGYEMGNKILIAITEHFLQHLVEGELLGRVGADNFIFLIKNSSAQELQLPAFIMNDVNDRIEGILPEHYSITFSVGVYSIVNTGEDFSLMQDKANFARKAIKGNHNVLIAEYTSQMNEQMEWKKEVTVSMEVALQKQEFEVFLQPKYLLLDEKLIGAEALIRWNHPKNGLLAPAMFISIFEENGFIRKLDLYVFETVCKLLRRWKDSGMDTEKLSISVNLSRMHLFNPQLVSELLALTDKYNISPANLEIELTESIVFHNTVLLIDIMKELRAAGFRISIDDFGSGYSSLNLLKDLPVDVLKIDKGFLSDSADIMNGRVIINAVTQMAKNLNLVTVAEGVETKEQAAMLLAMDCDIAQGYYYARPMPIESFEKLI